MKYLPYEVLQKIIIEFGKPLSLNNYFNNISKDLYVLSRIISLKRASNCSCKDLKGMMSGLLNRFTIDLYSHLQQQH